MIFSYLIVTRHRASDLELTLRHIKENFNKENEEVLVYIDACTETEKIIPNFPWVQWFKGKAPLGASPSRAYLYSHANGRYWIGLDDDAHILTPDFKNKIVRIFNNQLIGIIAFQEIKGVFAFKEEAIASKSSIIEEYECGEFIGCGFAIKKEVYEQTNGFPIWIDIYGEESCLSLEVLNAGYQIIYTNAIQVNHRIDTKQRKMMGKNYFRFEKQLTNTTLYYLVYYQNPLVKIIRLHLHNFFKYAIKDIRFFTNYLQSLLGILVKLPKALDYRKPINHRVIRYKNSLKKIPF